MEDIIAHRLVSPHKQPEYLVLFRGYGPEDNLWLPQKILQACLTDKHPITLRHIMMGHMFYYVKTAC